MAYLGVETTLFYSPLYIAPPIALHFPSLDEASPRGGGGGGGR